MGWVRIVLVGSIVNVIAIVIAILMVVGSILLLTSVDRLDQEMFSWFCHPEKSRALPQKHKKNNLYSFVMLGKHNFVNKQLYLYSFAILGKHSFVFKAIY